MRDKEPATAIINFCEYSIGSINPKVVSTAAIVLFGLIVTFKGEPSTISNALFAFLLKAQDILPTITDKEVALNVMLAEIRIMFGNKDTFPRVLEMKDQFIHKHRAVKNRI